MSVQMPEVYRDAVVLDGCSFFASSWTERQEVSGVTALQMTVPLTWSGAREALDFIFRLEDLCRREPRFTIVYSEEDIRKTKAEGRVGFVIGAQNAQHFEYDVELVQVFWDAGMRVTQLAYNERNLIGDGCLEPSNIGLSKFGKKIIAEMNRVGMVVDLSHVGERTSLEAIDISDKPCIISHANPNARVPNPRNVSDELMMACANAGGVVGLTSYAPLVWMGDGPPTIDDLIGHIEYAVDLIGIDAVSLGSDSEVTPGSYPPIVTSRLARDYPDATKGLRAAHPEVRKTVGVESMEQFPALSATLLDRGWGDDDIRKLFGENLLRAYVANWGA